MARKEHKSCVIPSSVVCNAANSARIVQPKNSLVGIFIAKLSAYGVIFESFDRSHNEEKNKGEFFKRMQ